MTTMNIPPPWRLTRAMRAQLRERPAMRRMYDNLIRQQQTGNEHALDDLDDKKLKHAWATSKKEK